MQRILLFVYCLLSIVYCVLLTANAQTTFQKTFGGGSSDYGYAVEQTNDGGYIVAGRMQGFGAGGDDVYLIKIDAIGDTLWTRTYGGGIGDHSYAVKQTNDGGYIVSGRTQSFGAGGYDVYLIKTDANGDTLWTRTYGGGNSDWGYRVEQTNDGGYIVTGNTQSFGAGLADVYLIKTDSIGDTLWTRTYGEGSNDYGFAVQQTIDGGYIVVGRTESFGAGSGDVYLIKTDANGDTLWTRTYGGGINDGGSAVQQTTDGGYIVVGFTQSFGAGASDVYLIKTDANGDTLWTKTYGGGIGDQGRAVVQTTDGGYIVTGGTASFGTGNEDVYLIKTDSNGDTLWTKTYGGGASEAGWAVKQTNDGGYIVAGGTVSFGAGGSVYLIKTDANGNSGCNEMGTQTIVSGGAIVGNPATIVGSGAIVNSTATVVSSPPTIDSILCEAIDSTITSDFIADDTIICEGDCINFFDISIGFPTGWQWSFAGAIPSTSINQNPINICYDTAGTYDVQLITTNTFGSDTLTQTNYITVNLYPIVDLSKDTTICPGDSVILNAGNPGASYSWSTGETTQKITVNTVDTYWVKIDDGSCIGNDTININTEDCAEEHIFFIPNSFSPNSDGDNDVLLIRGSGIKNIKLFIYNRWGEKVFETFDITKGWDGTYREKPLNTAVFAWYAEVEFEDANKIYRKGNVTLVR